MVTYESLFLLFNMIISLTALILSIINVDPVDYK